LFVFVWLPLAVSCGGDQVVEPFVADRSGRYSVSDTQQAAACSPQQLPRPISADTTQYARLPSALVEASHDIRIQRRDLTLSIVPLDRDGVAQTELTLTGTINAAQTIGLTFRTAAGWTEGLRDGGHTFYVTETSTDTTQFSLLPGTGFDLNGFVGATALSLITNAYTFRDDGAGGAVFAVCVVQQAMSGGWISP
jgi:hypothetical protein